MPSWEVDRPPLIPLVVGRGLILLVLASLLMVAAGENDVQLSTGPWQETRFHTGCDPGPFHAPPYPEYLANASPPLGTTPEIVALDVNLDVPASGGPRPILGSGFNLEHALWSCPEFRSLFRSQILDPFKPTIARVDTGLLPAAPADVPASELGPSVYESVL